MVFIGWTTSSLFIPRLSDLYSRKLWVLFMMALQFMTIIALMNCHSYKTTLGLLLVMGMCATGRWAISYVYMMEFLTEAQIKKVGPFINATAAFPIVIGAFLFQVVTKQTIVMEWIALTMNGVILVSIALLLPESPKLLINHKKDD